MNYRDYITLEANKRGGKPCVRGLRITVYEVLEYLASEMTEQEILEDFPDLTHEDLKACLAYAADRERRLIISPPPHEAALRCRSIAATSLPSGRPFSGCQTHVRDVGLQAADDPSVWEYERLNAFLIVSKDADMHDRSLLFGSKPKSSGCGWATVRQLKQRISFGVNSRRLRHSTRMTPFP